MEVLRANSLKLGQKIKASPTKFEILYSNAKTKKGNDVISLDGWARNKKNFSTAYLVIHFSATNHSTTWPNLQLCSRIKHDAKMVNLKDTNHCQQKKKKNKFSEITLLRSNPIMKEKCKTGTEKLYNRRRHVLLI